MRRVMDPDEVRCRPSPGCPLQDSCARFTSPIPTTNAKIGNFRAQVQTGPTGSACNYRLSVMVGPAAPPAQRATKPWPKGQA
jgi:hypothetical protein